MNVRALVTTLLLLVSLACQAVPAARRKSTVTQPDGTLLTVVTAGDEHAHYHVTEDGLMVAPNLNGEWKYVSTIMDGQILPGRITAHNPDRRTPAEKNYVARIDQSRLVSKLVGTGNSGMRPADLLATKGLSIPSKSPGRYSVTSFTPSGTVRGIVVLVDFPDRKFSLPDSLINDKFTRMYNQEGYCDPDTFENHELIPTGSVRDYFISQSFGQFTPEFDVIGPITATNGYAYYGNNGRTGKEDSKNAQKLVNEILDYLYNNKITDLSTYDSDGDREIDFMGFIYAGHGENYVEKTDPDCIWPHQWNISKRLGHITSVNYFMTCELLWDSKKVFDGIGTFCHEFSHALGLPDFYIAEREYALGTWSIMDYGTYNNQGYSPAGYLAFERYSLNWMDLQSIISPGSYTLGPLDRSQNAFRLDTDQEDQFIILENIYDTGWNAPHPGWGLLVTQVNYNPSSWFDNTPNSRFRKGYSILAADNNITATAEKSDLFPYGSLKDSITMYSTPSLKIDGGPSIYLAVRKIKREPDRTISFILDNYTTGIVTPGTDSGFRVTAQGSGRVIVHATAGVPVHIYPVNGSAARTIIADGTDMEISLPSQGTWIIQCGEKTEKVQY